MPRPDTLATTTWEADYGVAAGTMKSLVNKYMDMSTRESFAVTIAALPLVDLINLAQHFDNIAASLRLVADQKVRETAHLAAVTHG